MEGALDVVFEGLTTGGASAVEISGRKRAGLPWASYTSLEYPEFDLCEPAPITTTYDVVICEQVLEHVVDPWRAARTLRALAGDHGTVIVSTPFLIRVHEVPADYWRFTEDGLRVLLEAADLTVDHVDSWGNAWAVMRNLRLWRPSRWWHRRRNDPRFPLVVWAIARPRQASDDAVSD